MSVFFIKRQLHKSSHGGTRMFFGIILVFRHQLHNYLWWKELTVISHLRNYILHKLPESSLFTKTNSRITPILWKPNFTCSRSRSTLASLRPLLSSGWEWTRLWRALAALCLVWRLSSPCSSCTKRGRQPDCRIAMQLSGEELMASRVRLISSLLCEPSIDSRP